MGIVGLSGRDVVRLSTEARERAGQPRFTEAIGMNRDVLGFSPSGGLKRLFVPCEMLLGQLPMAIAEPSMRLGVQGTEEPN